MSSISAQLTLELSSIPCPLPTQAATTFFFQVPMWAALPKCFAKANSSWRHRTFQKKIWPLRNLLLLVSPYPLTVSIHPGEWAQSEEGALGTLLVRLRSSVNASVPTTMGMTGHQGGGLGQPLRPGFSCQSQWGVTRFLPQPAGHLTLGIPRGLTAYQLRTAHSSETSQV